jgi:hypothetical protein
MGKTRKQKGRGIFNVFHSCRRKKNSKPLGISDLFKLLKENPSLDKVKSFFECNKELDLNKKHDGSYAIFIVANHCFVHGIIKELLDNGADINTIDINGNTALHYAAVSKNMNVIDYFCNNHPEMIDKKNNKGETPLMKALSFFSDISVMYLIQKGADKTLVNIKGESCRDLIGSAHKDTLSKRDFEKKRSITQTILNTTNPPEYYENDINDVNQILHEENDESDPKPLLPAKKRKNKYVTENPKTVIETTTKDDLNPAPVNFRNKTRRTTTRPTLDEEMLEINNI